MRLCHPVQPPPRRDAQVICLSQKLFLLVPYLAGHFAPICNQVLLTELEMCAWVDVLG